jgi:hypothetical protein
MKMLATIALTLTLFTSLFAQDVMQTGVKHIKVLAEDDKVRVLHFTPSKGDKTPVHSHPETVLYVVKGGKIRTTLADGTSTMVELKAGQASLRPRSPIPTKRLTTLTPSSSNSRSNVLNSGVEVRQIFSLKVRRFGRPSGRRSHP